jgi:hypothetical protein
MKYLILLSLLLVSNLASAWFPVAAQVQVTAVSVTVAAQNLYPYPLFCEGQVFTQTASAPNGINLPFTMSLPIPGQWGVINVVAPYVNYGDYLIAVPQTALWCQYY